MATNRLQRALDRLEAHRIELERQIIAEIEELFFNDSQLPDINEDLPPSSTNPWHVFGDEHRVTYGNTPNSITWLDTD